MNKDNTLKHLSNIASGIFSSLEGVKSHSKQIIKSKIVENLKNLDLINREEFEEIKSIIIKAREQNSILEAKIKTLEKKLRKHK
jgi:BMFP domain-containing protein YqiC